MVHRVWKQMDERRRYDAQTALNLYLVRVVFVNSDQSDPYQHLLESPCSTVSYKANFHLGISDSRCQQRECAPSSPYHIDAGVTIKRTVMMLR